MPEVRPKVSIVTPVFNRAAIVHRTIDSVVGQNYGEWEFLLVDDGSSDDIEEVAVARYGSDERVRFVRRDRLPKGASTCRNIGAELARGDFLIFLDSDDFMEPHCLSQRVAVMAEHPGLDLAVFPFSVLTAEGTRQPNNFDNGLDPLVNFLSYSSYWAIMCPIWRTSFFRSAGGFNELFPRYQDPELYIRALTVPGVSYRMFMALPADTVVVPSPKSYSIHSATQLFASLNLLLPQCADYLTRAGNVGHLRYLKGYLREWFRQFTYANFDEEIARLSREVLTLFRRHGVIGAGEERLFAFELATLCLLRKGLRYLYLKRLEHAWRS